MEAGKMNGMNDQNDVHYKEHTRITLNHLKGINIHGQMVSTLEVHSFPEYSKCTYNNMHMSVLCAIDYLIQWKRWAVNKHTVYVHKHPLY